ncbi:hypothetical protein F2Q69_00049672 [Brassica cretica]|uniref:Uncharacterized protein n=1 Tax=Brassica cretica TaxID=69181 RepID=A0A8S9Q211_BRACR|nr:hypothetical protein F2Q69_00049672 [Brassica cretica]
MKHVVTFGSPFVSCGGEKILEELGLDERHVHCVMMMHRDIVPRAFSCNYPDFVALILKLLNGSSVNMLVGDDQSSYVFVEIKRFKMSSKALLLIDDCSDSLLEVEENQQNQQAKSFLWVTLCLKGVALLGVWAERATTTGASAGWEVNTMVWGSSKSGEGEGASGVLVGRGGGDLFGSKAVSGGGSSIAAQLQENFLDIKGKTVSLSLSQETSKSKRTGLQMDQCGGTRPNSMISDLCNDGVWSLPSPRSEDQLALHAYLTTVTLTDSEETVSLSSPKHLRLLSLLAWQATIYTLWTERNSRIHRNEFRSADSLSTSTIALIKNRISSFRYSSPALSSAMMQIWLDD